MKTFNTLLKTEINLSIRDMNMPIFAIIMPVVVVMILGAVFGSRPAFEGAAYTFFDQSFGAVCTIAICGGGVMGLPLMISDYRGKKLLKRFKVTPTSPSMLLAVQVTLYALYAVASLVLVYAVSALFFGFSLRGAWLPFAGAYLLVLTSMFSIGVLVGGVAPNVRTAGILTSLLYFPMLVFSGATLPYEVMPAAMQRMADVMPLTQGIKLLKAASLGLPMGEVTLPVTVMAVLAVVCVGVSIRFFRWE